MAKFDTTQQKSIYPGISATQGVVDTSGAIKPGMIGDIGAVSKMALEGATQIDKLNALEDARLNAEAIANDYLAGSHTEQNYLASEQRRLSNQVSNTTGEEQSAFMKELGSVNERLVRAKAQGAMTPYEFSRRVAKVNTDLARSNPAYTSEITAKMNEVFRTTGINDVIQADAKYAEAQAKAQDDHRKLIFTTLEKYHVDPYRLDDQQLMEEFDKVRAIEVSKNELELAVQREGFLDDYDNERNYNTIQAKGGLTRVRQAYFHGIDNEVMTILSDPQSDFRQKKRQIQNVIEQARIKYNTLVEALPQDKKAVASFMTQTEAMFTDMSKRFEEEVTLEDYKKYAGNRKAIIDSTLDANFMLENGASFQMIESLDKLASAYKNAQKTLGRGGATKKLESMLSSLGGRIISDPGGMDPELADLVNDAKGKPYNNVVKQSFATIVPDIANNGGEVPESTYKLATNELVFLNDISDPAVKVQRIDTTLKSHLGVPQEAFDKLYSRPEFKQQLNSALNAYNGLVYTDLAQMKQVYGPEWQIKISPERGEVYSDVPQINQALNRVNAYIKLRAKIANQLPKDIVETIIRENFDVLGANQ